MRKIAIILLFVMIMNLFPSLAFADSRVPEVNIAGNMVTVTSNVAPGERTAITITDRNNKNNIRFIDQNTFEDGRAVFKAELPNGNYSVFISNNIDKQSVDFEISGNVTVNGEYVTIRGNTEPNSKVTLTVVKENDAVVHIDQASSNNKGEYSFSVQLVAGNYKAYVKSSSEEEAKVYEFATYKTDTAYTLRPENQSRNNKYNVEFSIEFDFPVEIADNGEKQITLEAKKKDSSADANYPKDFTDVFGISENNPKKVVIDLKNAGERLDVDRYYTVILYDNIIMNKDKGTYVKLSDISWSFDTVWQGFRPEIFGNQDGGEGEFDWEELERLNGFDGLYAGQVFQMKYISPPTFDFDKNQYPLNFEVYPNSIGEIDRNGILTVKDNVQGTIYVIISAEGMTGEFDLSIEIKNNLKQKMQILEQRPFELITDLQISKNSGIYFIDGNLNDGYIIRGCDKDLNIKEGFYPYTLKNLHHGGGIKRERLYGIVNIDGREYLNVSLVRFSGTGDGYTNLIDGETGEIYRDEIPLLGVQLEDGSSIFTVWEGQYIRFYDVVKKEFAGGRYKYDGSGVPIVKAYDGIVYILHRGYVSVIDYKNNSEKDIDLSSLDINYSTDNFIVSKDGYIYIVDAYRDQGKIFKIDSGGNKLWEETDFLGIAGDITEFENGNIGIGVKINTSEDEPDILLNILEAETGNLIKSIPAYAPSFSNSTDLNYLGEHASNIYINGMVLNSSYEPVAYTDISSPGRKVYGSQYLIDGYIYRISTGYGEYSQDFRLEKGLVIDEYAPIPSEIIIEDEIIVRENTDAFLNASAIDQYGFITQANIIFTAEENDILSVEGNILKIRSLGEDLEREVNITARIEGTNISKSIKIIIRKASVPQRLYIIDGHKGNKIENNIQINEINITTRLGGGFRVFVEDQYGEFMNMEPIEYIVENESIAGTRLYQGNSGKNEIKYQALVDGKRIGETTITARLKEYPNISASIKVNVTDVDYEIIWEIGTDGPWDGKKAYHADGIYDDFIYTNVNYLAALNKYDGSQLWKIEMGAHYGMEISPPYIDSDGIIYVHDLKSTGVAAVDSKNGERLWRKTYGSDTTADFDISSEYIYILTSGGMLIKADKEGNKLWEVKAASENVKDMEVSPDGKVYVVSRNIIYEADSDGGLKEIYRADQSERLNIRDINSNGYLIAEKVDGRNQYEALCISTEGQLKWKQAVIDEFTARWEADRVYILSHVQGSGNNSHLYAYYESGEEIFEPIDYLPGSYYSMSYYEKERKPVVKNGKVYTYISRTYCFDSMTGEEFWNVYIRDTYDPSRPYSLTVGDDGTVYTSTGGRGMFAYIVKGQASEGFNISLSNAPVLKNGSLAAISLNLYNNTEEDYENFAVSAELQRITADSFTSQSKMALYKDLAAGEREDLMLYVNIPQEGSYKVVIKAVSEDGDTLDILELPVKSGGKQ